MTGTVSRVLSEKHFACQEENGDVTLARLLLIEDAGGVRYRVALRLQCFLESGVNVSEVEMYAGSSEEQARDTFESRSLGFIAAGFLSRFEEASA